jgi:maltose O-acetyltransferase
MAAAGMSELEKCRNGEVFNTADPEIGQIMRNARTLLRRYNSTEAGGGEERTRLLRKLLGGIGSNVHVDRPFYCDYGMHTTLGDNVIIGMNCIFVDNNRITIGNNVLIASGVQLCTSTHSTRPEERMNANGEAEGRPWFRTYALPITIGDGAWIGAGAIVLPGVTIGERSVIGAGSVVNRDIPADSVAVGNPCRVIRSTNE